MDKALPWVDRLLQDPALSPPGRHQNTTWADWFDRARRLALRLAAAGCRDDARRFLALAGQAGKESGLFFAPALAETTKAVESGKPRLVITSLPQAETALQLGMITQKRYEQALERLGVKGERANERDRRAKELLDNVTTRGGFLALPGPVHLEEAEPSGLVPEPGYLQTSPETLTPAQRWEYRQAFASPSRSDLIPEVRLRPAGGHPPGCIPLAGRRPDRPAPGGMPSSRGAQRARVAGRHLSPSRGTS